MKVFYHNDMDGKCAGAIVNKFYKEFEARNVDPQTTCLPMGYGEPREFIRIDYKDDFPFDRIIPEETIVIVDFSLQKEGEFKRLIDITPKIIWIDHHKSAMEKHGNLELLGIRRDGTAGCELTWEFFYPHIRMSRIVELVGDYDVWRFKYGEATNRLQTGIRLYDTRPESDNWETWLDPEYSPIIELEKGEVTLKYRDNYYAGLIKSWSFMTEFEGYKVIACNAGSVSSQLFDTVTEEYDLMMPFCFDGGRWAVSIYTKRDDIDCSEIAKRYGGGGHKQAAGFQCKELPFENQQRHI